MSVYLGLGCLTQCNFPRSAILLKFSFITEGSFCSGQQLVKRLTDKQRNVNEQLECPAPKDSLLPSLPKLCNIIEEEAGRAWKLESEEFSQTPSS